MCQLSKLDNGMFDTTPKNDQQRLLVARNANQSPLLRLPSELRELICNFTLAGNIIKPAYASRRWAIRPPKHRFSLLRVCRQIYAETASLPYSLSTFSFSTIYRYQEFCDVWYHDAKEKKRLIHFVQVGVDPLDLYGFAEEEEQTEEELEQGWEEEDYHLFRFTTFPALERLDFLVARTTVEDVDEGEGEQSGYVGGERSFSASEVSDAMENMSKVMKDKKPSVRVGCKEFPDGKAMKTYWEITTTESN
ncbi:hypothetical protein EJ02DRAFT_163886 [Clathrospora elynae]|uniref:Uncharacterized protein n=1 Tax=Clathrospora elynae TaxID=706981 RepID=A0A6A5T0G6_9PLEO|nr:hypothetical protein EJ02DRAFT_163886 [Clathrospora elynae]